MAEIYLNRRNQLISKKSFLRSLLTSQGKLKKILHNADNSEIEILTLLCHWFASGDIAIEKKLLTKITKGIAIKIFRKYFVKEQAFTKLTNFSRSKKIKVLLSLSLLLPLFIKQLIKTK